VLKKPLLRFIKRIYKFDYEAIAMVLMVLGSSDSEICVLDICDKITNKMGIEFSMRKCYPALNYLEKLEYVVGYSKENTPEDNLILKGNKRKYFRLINEGVDLYYTMKQILISNFRKSFYF
jgi:DNA-binding PadR family transcriptional regulator